jgi:hypothetical protein
VLELAIDWKVMRGLGFRDYFRMVEALDLDAVPVNQVLYLLGWRRCLGPLVRRFRDGWGTGYQVTEELLPFPNRFPIACLEDLERYRPPRPEDDPLLAAVRLVARRCPRRAVLLASRADFAASWYLCGLDRLLVSYIEAPELALRLAEMVSSYYERLLPLAAAQGAQIIVLTDDYAQKTGCLMSRDHFRRFILPGLRRVVGAVKGAGAFCIKHSDGDIGAIADLLVDTGIDALGPLAGGGHGPGRGQTPLRRPGRRAGQRGRVVVPGFPAGSGAGHRRSLSAGCPRRRAWSFLGQHPDLRGVTGELPGHAGHRAPPGRLPDPTVKKGGPWARRFCRGSLRLRFLCRRCRRA